MATSTIKNPHVPGSVLAESTGNKTYTQHLTALYSVYTSLSAEQKKICSIVIDNRVFHIMNADNTATFTRLTEVNVTPPKLYIGMIFFSSGNPKYMNWEISASGNTATEISETSYNGTLQLVCGL